MTNKVCDSLMFSMNPTGQSEAFSKQVQGDILGTCHKVKSALGALADTAGSVVELAADTFKEAKSLQETGLQGKDVSLIPTCLENIFGKKYAGNVCGPDEIDTDSEISHIAKEVGTQVIQQSDRKDLNLEIIVKKDDEDSNAFVIPGGKIVVTSGLLNELYDNSASVEEFKNRLSGTLGYLVAKASRSHQIKQAQLGGLFSIINKVIGFVFEAFFPVSQAPKGKKVKLSPEEKKQQAIGKIVGQSVDLGGRLLQKRQKNTAEQEARELALRFAQKAGFAIDDDLLDDTLEIALYCDDEEEFEDEVQERFAKLLPQVSKLFV